MITPAVWPLLWQSWLLALEISLATLAGGLVLGAIVAGGKRSAFGPWRLLCSAYAELAKTLPLLALVFVLYYLFFSKLGLSAALGVGVLLLSVSNSAGFADLICAGIETIPAIQIDSARSMGLSKFQIQRLVILPQAFRHMLPGLGTRFVSILKQAALLSVLLILGAGERTAQPADYLALILSYLVVTLPISLWARAAGKKRAV